MTRLILAILLGALTLPMAAQSIIDRTVAKIENAPDVETTYVERRNPKTKKLYHITKSLSFSNSAYYTQLERAFDQDRENTISAVKNQHQIVYKFENKRGVSTYSLTRHSPYTFVMTWRASDVISPDEAMYDQLGCPVDPLGETAYTTADIEPASGSGCTMTVYNLSSHIQDIDKRREALAHRLAEISTEMSRLNRKNKQHARRYLKLNDEYNTLRQQLSELSASRSHIATSTTGSGTTIITYNF